MKLGKDLRYTLLFSFFYLDRAQNTIVKFITDQELN